MRWKRILIATCIFVCCTFSVAGQDLAKLSRPEDSGFSTERLARITKFFQGDVDKGAIPGAVLLVARDGKVVYLQTVGYQDREKRTPMKADAIFRIASMTKPITSVAVMMLAEEGKIDLLAPVTQYCPEFKDVKVGVEKTDGSTGKPALSLEDAHRTITVQDLLRHTSGLVYGPFGNSLVHQAYNKANLFDGSQTLAEFVTKLSKLPLAHQPGSVWEYGMSTDVLARIVEVVSGMPFDRFVEARITEPLGMHDTAFYLSAAQSSRLAEPQVDPATGRRPGASSAEDLTKEKQKWFSGGGGLLSTASDYARFCQMLLNGGELNGVRLLSPKTLTVMTSDQLPPGIPRFGLEDLAPTLEMGQSFGLGFAVRTDAGHSPVSGSRGDYFWAGAHGTYFWVDPQEKVFAVMMVQMPFLQSGYYRRAMRELVYGALVH
ncbi:MAG TPA: serine hydrolase domain-containing protein [Candidatus Acidoferrum sp.]|nr:serine hydrolase domain-containing protein [Candidatus Acidoferrum sp.]